MIKTVKKIGKIVGKYEIPVDILEFYPPIKLDHPTEAEFVTGGVYNSVGLTKIAFYISDEDGNITDTIPIIQEEGINSYEELFRNLGYTLI